MNSTNSTLTHFSQACRSRHNKIKRIELTLFFLLSPVIAALALSCYCDHTIYQFTHNGVRCVAQGYPICLGSEDSVGCYYCREPLVQLQLNCEDGSSGTMSVTDCRTDDVGFCGETIDC